MTDFLRNKRVTIVGAAKSGQAAARLVLRHGGKVKISDNGPDTTPPEFQKWVSGNKIPTQWNGHTQDFIEASDLIILSPGVPINAKPVIWAKAKKIPVIGEIELAYRFCNRPIIAVTGSNGKTTVSTLIRNIIAEAGHGVALGGNIGNPFADFVEDLGKIEYVVLEISSFQLETIVDFKPHVAVFTNFSQNHLDRHKDVDEYFEAKTRLFMNQDKNDFAVLNAQNERIRDLAPKLKARALFFNQQPAISNPNYLAVIEVAKALKIKPEVCEKVFANFKGVEHRLEWVRTIAGVDYINDSKATTAEAGRWALESIQKPIVMICGGRDKNIDFSVLRDLVKKKVKKMIVIGEAKAKLKDTFANVVDVEESPQLDEAVSRAKSLANQGDCVLLSPMCASFDMFKNFEHRGQVFKDIVRNLNGN
jgi:UDP-N-acetylmuramoylalanine--D-glutamate ligase